MEITQAIPENCDIKTIITDFKIWHTLRPNVWLYVISKKTVVTIDCNDNIYNIEEIELKGTGLFMLFDHCNLSTNQTLLTARTKQGHNITTHFFQMYLLLQAHLANQKIAIHN